MFRGWLIGLALLLAPGCDDGLVPSPFASDRAPDAAPPDAGANAPDGGAAVTPVDRGPREVLGGPCVDDAQCDDGVECTFGACDPELGLCRFTADDARCADDVFCNGVEQCHPVLGCRPGPPESCSDSTPCTIDRCDEVTRSCVRIGRDFDGDGDVDGNCAAGSDCNDLDPLVASTEPELCANERDDDCDGELDEGDCQVPRFDTCADALQLSAPGSYVASAAGAALNYGASCAPETGAARELVLSVSVPADRDVELVARASAGALSFVKVGVCGDPATELECITGTRPPAQPSGAARIRLRAGESAAVPVYLLADASSDIQLDVTHDEPLAAPDNRSCDARLPLVPGEPADVDLAFSSAALDSACPTERGDLFYEFTLTDPADIVVFAQVPDGFGEARLSLRAPSCVEIESERACAPPVGAPLFVRALPAGTWVLAASATGPARYPLTLEVRPPSAAPASEQCNSAPPVALNETDSQALEAHVDDIEAGCSPGLVDAARRLVLDAPSDVLVVARFANIDAGSVALAGAACRAEDTRICTRSTTALARVSQRAMPAGEHRIVVESQLGLLTTLTTLVRPARAPTLVAGAEGCANPMTIGEAGGFFQGNTGNAEHDLTASCDFATPSGAPDQLLRLVLERPRRMIFDMRGSDFETLLNVRRGPSCPGEEVGDGCVVMGGGDRSFLDKDLPAGEYFVQIDGYAGASGSWFLDVYSLEPR